MAYTTQMQFLKIRFPHELNAELPDNSGYTIKAYDGCGGDTRSWSLDKLERAQYLLELLCAKEHPHPKERMHAAEQHHETLKAQCDAKQTEIDSKNQIKELQERIASLACQLESNQCCKTEVDCLQNSLNKLQCEIEELAAELKCVKEANKSMNKKNNELSKQLEQTCTKANQELEALQKKNTELECQLTIELEKGEDVECLKDENAELKQNLEESCKKIRTLQQEACAKDKLAKKAHTDSVCSVKPKDKMSFVIEELTKKVQNLEEEKCCLQNEIRNNEQLKIAEAEICQLTNENVELRKQMEATASDRQSDDASTGSETPSEDYETVKEERDCLKNKFHSIEPDLEEVAQLVEDYAELEKKNNELEEEIEIYKCKEEKLIVKMKTLLNMQKEFEHLQQRVSESERLLNEYQVLQKLECLRAGYTSEDDETDQQDNTTVCSDTSGAYDSQSTTIMEEPEKVEVQIAYGTKKRKRRCSPRQGQAS